MCRHMHIYIYIYIYIYTNTHTRVLEYSTIIECSFSRDPNSYIVSHLGPRTGCQYTDKMKPLTATEQDDDYKICVSEVPACTSFVPVNY